MQTIVFANVLPRYRHALVQHPNVQVAYAFHVVMELRAAILVKHVKGEVANVELP